MLENGFNGFPRASRSARVRGLNGKKFESGQNRSFDILASVAGKLLDKSWDRFCCACDDNDSSSKKLCDEGDHSHDIDVDFGPATMIDSSDTNNNNSNNNVPCFRGNIEESVKEEESETVTDISRNQKMSEANDETRCDNKDEKQLEDMYDENERIRRTNHENSQKIFPFKKRKFFNNYPLSNSDQKEHFNPPENRITVKTCTASQKISPKSPECNVKLSIKSFKVPELFIDISTHATVGSLKRTVMEAVTSILGDGLHVGILVQGKRVRDDNKTLIQTGISLDDKCHNLGFVLEPKHSKTTIPSSLKNNEPSFSKPRSQGLNRRSVSLGSQQGTLKTSPSCVESDISEGSENVADDSSNDMDASSKALVTYVPRIGVKALTAVPLHRKSGHHEYGQRRIRRPFSVSEVEALVRAVEKLGTGRWRDVKFHAFDNAKHRTYVDLKDKWKTLVHTARISPQQRRGEPVPQELLDRVLAAQAYWSHRQAKQHAMLTV